jgi:hypothetical protein
MKKSDGGSSGNPPSLMTVEANQSGRTGKDLLIAVRGSDPDFDIVTARLRSLDAQGNPVNAFDANHDGTPDSSEAPATIDGASYVGQNLSATIMLRGFMAKPTAAVQLGVVLIDATALETGELTAGLTPQAVVESGQPCDATFITSRCNAGLGCRGAPPTCQEGKPPEITKFAFYKQTGGPLILLEGTEPEDDLQTVKFQFQNAQGGFISIDSDGDGTPDLASFDFDAKGQAVDGTFFIRFQAGENLDQQVPKLVAQASDFAGHQGALKTAAPTTVPIKSAGSSCDPRGFDACAVNLVCSPGIVGQANKCASATNLRTAVCKAAPVLEATPAGATIIGRTSGTSLWDAPSGCSSNDPKGRPDGLVTLRLTALASKLTLSTNRPGTNFDTTLYLLAGCPGDSTAAFGCSDDVPNNPVGASELVLSNLAAGDYQIVVDSFDFAGGTFELSAKVE